MLKIFSTMIALSEQDVSKLLLDKFKIVLRTLQTDNERPENFFVDIIDGI